MSGNHLIKLQDELVEDSVRVSDEELDEEKVADAEDEFDGDDVANKAGAEIKKSAPAKAPEPKTKAGMLNAMYSKMSKMKKDEMKKAYESMCAEGFDPETDAEAIAENLLDLAQTIEEQSFEEDLNALVESEATLSEGFKDKASVIFEAALKSKLNSHINRLEEQYAEELNEEKARIEQDLTDKIDSYLNYVVEQWVEDNKLAVESGLRAEIAENFMSALHGVFVENYIQVPESKVDLVDELSEKVAELEENLNTAIESNVKLNESVKELSREAIIREAAAGLSETQAEKLKSLVEDVTFGDVDTFTSKVETIKESYFKEAKPEVIAEDTALETQSVSPRMSAYLKALSKQ